MTCQPRDPWVWAAFLTAWAGLLPAADPACRGCHQAFSAQWEDHPMARSWRAAGTGPAEWGSTTTEVRHPLLAIRYRVQRKGNQVWQTEIRSESDGFPESYPLDVAIGSGAHGVTYAVRRGGHLFQAPLSWFSEAGKWALSPGYERTDGSFLRPVNSACQGCHGGDGMQGIDCKDCHRVAPGHKTGSPVRMESREAERLCLNCHSAAAGVGSDRSMDVLGHAEALLASRCSLASNRGLTCLTCHSVHGQQATGCAQCHSSSQCKDKRGRLTEVRQWRGCAQCHMPRVPIPSVAHTQLTEHRINAKRPAPSLP